MGKSYNLGPLMSFRRFPDNYHKMNEEEKKKCEDDWRHALLNPNQIHPNLFYYREVIFDEGDFGSELPDEFNPVKKEEYNNNFFTKAKEVHGDKYDYSNTVYINNRTNVNIVCPEHGVFSQRPDNHLQGKGCIKCTQPYNTRIVDSQNTFNRLSPKTIKFIAKSQKIHGDKYDYTNTIYVKSKHKLEIVCNEHGSFYQSPNHHLRGTGCPECGLKKIGYGKKIPNVNKTEVFISKAQEIHDNKYNYDNTIYVSCNGKVNVSCPEHGVFSQRASNHLYGAGCPKCGVEKRAFHKRKLQNLLTEEKEIENVIPEKEIPEGDLSPDFLDFLGMLK